MNLEPVCPECRIKPDPAGDGSLKCRQCGNLFRNSADFRDFRVSSLPGDRIRDEWDADQFDRVYSAALDSFEDGFAHSAKQGIPDFIECYRQRFLKNRIAEWITTPDDKNCAVRGKVLDIGCGHGWFGYRLVSDYGFRGELYGVDISPFNINLYMKKITMEKINNIFPFAAYAEKLPFSNDSFDLAFATETLEHTASPQLFFQEAWRVLKPGGELIITTPSSGMCRFWEAFFFIPRIIYRLFSNKRSVAENVFDKPLPWRTIRDAAENAGFSIVFHTKSIFLPHESYIRFFPRIAQKIMLWKAVLFEHLKPFSTPFGLHHIIRLEKRV